MGGGFRDSDWSRDSHRDRNRDNDRQRSYRSYSNARRSSDYRTEDSHSKSDDYDYSDRKYRSQNEHRNRDYRDRDSSSRRSRSRSRSSERDNRSYDHDSNKNYDRYEDRDRNKEKKEVPNNTLMIRNLPLHFTDTDLSSEINKYGLYPKDVRLMKNKETGQSRGFAFIEFETMEQAIQLKQMTKGCILIDNELECTLHFSFPKDAGPGGDKNGIKNDWSCPKCGINNFKRRDECFKCGTSKDDTRQFDKSEVVQHPTNVLSLRNLSLNTTEARVLTIIGTLTSMPIKSIRIAQDSYSCNNMCTLELHSVYEATQLFNIISSMASDSDSGFVIDDALVSIGYGQRIDNSSVASTSHSSQNAAMAALAAAQWKNLDDSSGKGKLAPTKAVALGTVTVNGVEYTKYATPDYASFQYDATSGYYYDPSTGFYYDTNSRYFYNSQTQKYMYYDAENQIYVTVDSTGHATADNSATINSSTVKNNDIVKKSEDNVTKQDKVKSAKKIAREMEKWAKTLNRNKEYSKPLPQAEMVPVVEMNESISLDSASLLERQQQQHQPQPVATNFELPVVGTTPALSNSDPFEIVKAEEEKLTDWERLACLLCKRQFSNCELLTKHKQMSELHKTNLTVLRQTLLNEEQLLHMENVERELAYRDRAKERREKFGIDDTPEFSKQKPQETKPNDALSAPALPISDDNIGSKMLKAMGWSEGKGLGRKSQGSQDIIQVERRRGGLGLGSNNSTFTRESYKDAVRRTALQRFKELSDS